MGKFVANLTLFKRRGLRQSYCKVLYIVCNVVPDERLK
jgi:hypothetical protein